MAKRQPKKKVDPLRVSLKLLAHADRESARAVRSLCKAIFTPVQEPGVKVCKFEYENKKYTANVTSDHYEKIMAVLKRNGDVAGLLSDLTKQVANDIDNLVKQLGEPAALRKKAGKRPMLTGTIALGCCVYNGGSTPNLSQSQCSHYNPVRWDPGNPTCSPHQTG